MKESLSESPRWTAAWDREPDLDRLKYALRLLKTNPSQAARVFEELAQVGSVMSMMYLGWMYHNRNKDPEGLARAEFWYRRALDSGYIPATRLLGDVYRRMSNYNLALKTFEVGDKNNYLPATFRIGVMKLKGQGMRRDVSGAIDIWERASKRGHLLSKRNLARLYISGAAGARNIPKGAIMMWNVFLQLIKENKLDPNGEVLR
jgi:uncharacterized protein